MELNAENSRAMLRIDIRLGKYAVGHKGVHRSRRVWGYYSISRAQGADQ